MKFLVLAACLAVSSAQGFFGLQSHPNGAITPIDEPRVAAARADHLAAHGIGHGVGYAHGAYAASYPYAAAYPYAQSFFGLQAHPNGAITPVNEPAVAAARAEHFAALGHAYHADPALAVHTVAPISHAAPHYAGLGYAAGYGYSGPLAGVLPLVSHPNGAIVPADEPAVAAARAEHLSHHGGVYGGVYAGLGHATYGAGYGYAGPLAGVLPLVSHPNGAIVPVDEPAVAAARAEHLSHHGLAHAIAPVVHAAPHHGGLYAGLAHATGYGYAGPLAGVLPLVSHPNGAIVPADEPAVAAARAEHLSHHGLAHAVVHAAPHHGGVYAGLGHAAYGAGYGYAGPLAGVLPLVSHPNGAIVPADEPAVAAARAAHLSHHGVVHGGVYAGHGNVAYGAGYGYAPYAGLIAHPNGAIVPVDEPAVAAARAEHLAHHG